MLEGFCTPATREGLHGKSRHPTTVCGELADGAIRPAEALRYGAKAQRLHPCSLKPIQRTNKQKRCEEAQRRSSSCLHPQPLRRPTKLNPHPLSPSAATASATQSKPQGFACLTIGVQNATRLCTRHNLTRTSSNAHALLAPPAAPSAPGSLGHLQIHLGLNPKPSSFVPAASVPSASNH